MSFFDINENIFFFSFPKGLLFSTPECLKAPVDLGRLVMHEVERVYGDKMIEESDIETFNKVTTEYAKKYFEVSIQYRYFLRHFLW